MNIRTDIGHLLRLLYSCTYWHFYVEVDTAHLPGAAYFELGFQNIFSGTTCLFSSKSTVYHAFGAIIYLSNHSH